MNIAITTTTITGHLAMFQTVTAVSPTPITSPIARASGPVTTIAIATIASSRTIARVIAICGGRRVQNGRPSSTS